MSDQSQRPIVIKRIKKGGGGAHGGAWKIAYADFVTAMMAFFLLMWLLGSTAEGDLQGIAQFFQNPLKVGNAGGSGAGDASSVLKGGGTDLTRTAGQVKKGENEAKRRSFSNQAHPSDKQATEKAERGKLQELKAQIEAMVEAKADLRQFRDQLLLDITSEGLRIQIVDEKNRPMFDTASSELKSYARDILRVLGRQLNKTEHRISLSGHTDATPYSGGDKGFGNWELSTSRANASRRELIAGGLEEGKMVRVVGLASTIPFKPEDPFDPTNRRISIVVMNKKTEEAVLREGRAVEVDGERPLEDEMLSLPPAAAPGPKTAPH